MYINERCAVYFVISAERLSKKNIMSVYKSPGGKEADAKNTLRPERWFPYRSQRVATLASGFGIRLLTGRTFIWNI